jgi:protein-L-isoaspartate(D-aspartate) O-methyltransferase
LVTDGQAADGSTWLRLENRTPGRGSQALQALGMDGRKVKEIELSAWAATRDVVRGLNAHELPRLELNFFDEQRAPIGSQRLGPWLGTRQWQRHQARIRVPAQARLAVLAVGLFGATGQLYVDDVMISVVQQTSPP